MGEALLCRGRRKRVCCSGRKDPGRCLQEGSCKPGPERGWNRQLCTFRRGKQSPGLPDPYRMVYPDIKRRGVPLEKITGGIASWERSQASAMMEQWLTDYPDQIELVICNNDDMALGAIDAIERAGILPGTIKLAGIDATPPGVEALKAGKLLEL